MRSVPGALRIIGGGGADAVLATVRNDAGVLATATTEGPDRSSADGATAASGITAESRVEVFVDGAAAPTAPASTSGVRTAATPKAGIRMNCPVRSRAATRAAPPRI